MNLFQKGKFTLHSGEESNFKIECDALTPEDWAAVAQITIQNLGLTFGDVEGVPRGGLPFAKAILDTDACQLSSSTRLLIVDDVWTTGNSMEEHRNGRDAIGVVLFARGRVAKWVTPIFSMNGFSFAALEQAYWRGWQFGLKSAERARELAEKLERDGSL